ncbi:MAG: adenosylcobinamide amidohydrolase [Nitrospirales bacterium]
MFNAQSLIPEATIGLMTAANVSAFTDRFLYTSGVWVHAFVTVGLSNARSVLDDADGEWWEPAVKLKRIIVPFTWFLRV